MPRPKRTTSEESAFTLKFALEERELADRCVEARKKELREVAGSDVEVTLASYIRWLVQQDAERRGLAGSSSKRKK